MSRHSDEQALKLAQQDERTALTRYRLTLKVDDLTTWLQARQRVQQLAHKRAPLQH